jgi:steroid delta-isomerase-like uncharacterized protein
MDALKYLVSEEYLGYDFVLMADNTQILMRFIDECWNRRNRSICMELLSGDYEHYMPGSEQPTVGPDAYQELVDGFLEGFPDTRFDIDEVFGDGERVCVMWTVHATHSGPFNGIAATGKPVVVKGVGVARVVDGRIVRIVSMFDNDSFTRQLDAPAEKAVESWKKK